MGKTRHFIKHLDNLSDDALCTFLKEGREDVFSEIYERYWERLYSYAFNRVNSHDVAFEITQDIFVSLWARRDEIDFRISLSAYLYAAARYQIIHHIRHSKVRSQYAREFAAFRLSLADNSNEETVNLHQLEDAVEQSLEGLTKRCREIFRMSRQQNKSIQEIADTLNISHRTVENQLTMALKHLRISLGEFITVILFLVLWH